MSFPALSATKARQNFFKLLDQVEQGVDAIIVKKDRNKKFRLTMVPEKTANLEKVLDTIASVGLKTTSVTKMKQIILTSHDLHL